MENRSNFKAILLMCSDLILNGCVLTSHGTDQSVYTVPNSTIILIKNTLVYIYICNEGLLVPVVNYNSTIER